jgi:hypothetical protein
MAIAAQRARFCVSTWDSMNTTNCFRLSEQGAAALATSDYARPELWLAAWASEQGAPARSRTAPGRSRAAPPGTLADRAGTLANRAGTLADCAARYGTLAGRAGRHTRESRVKARVSESATWARCGT